MCRICLDSSEFFFGTNVHFQWLCAWTAIARSSAIQSPIFLSIHTDEKKCSFRSDFLPCERYSGCVVCRLRFGIKKKHIDIVWQSGLRSYIQAWTQHLFHLSIALNFMCVLNSCAAQRNNRVHTSNKSISSYSCWITFHVSFDKKLRFSRLFASHSYNSNSPMCVLTCDDFHEIISIVILCMLNDNAGW